MIPRYLVAAAALLVSGCRPSLDQTRSLVQADARGSTHHYVYFEDRQRISEESFLKTPALEGAQIMYMWKELESAEGVYDFSVIQKDLDFLRSKGKGLFIQLQDATFEPNLIAVPDYIVKDPKYHGGVAIERDGDGKPNGVTAMRWDPAVRAQFQKLLGALGAAFDGEIAGLNLQESAIDITETGPQAAPGFTYVGYRDALLDNMGALRRSFAKSVSMQYVNFMPGEWLPDEDRGYMSSLFAYAQKNGVSVGAPDLMPKRPNQQNHAYKFMHAMKGTMTLGIAVQDGNYASTTGADDKPTGPWPDIVPDLADYAETFLGVNYLFWGAQEPYFSHDVIPYFQPGHS